MSQTYGLYQTFSSDTPEKDLSEEEKKELDLTFKILNTEQKKAVFFLIIEHAKITEDYIYDPKNIIFPYNMIQNENSIEFDLENLPIKLKWILLKFSKIIDKSN
jgi:hypothetical protein